MPWIVVICFMVSLYCLVETALLMIVEKDPVSAVFEGTKALVLAIAGYQICSLI